MGFVILLGRILYALIFIGSGSAGHLMQTEGTAAYAEMRGVPNSRVLTLLSGIAIFVGGLAVILGVWADLAALGLALYSLIAAFLVHHFWNDQDEMMKQSEMSQFMKNLAMAGGGLILAGFLAATGDAAGYMLTDPLFDVDY